MLFWAYDSDISFSCPVLWELPQTGPFPGDQQAIPLSPDLTIQGDGSRGVEFVVKNPSDGCLFRTGGSSPGDEAWIIEFVNNDQNMQIKVGEYDASLNLTDDVYHHFIISYGKTQSLHLFQIAVDDMVK